MFTGCRACATFDSLDSLLIRRIKDFEFLFRVIRLFLGHAEKHLAEVRRQVGSDGARLFDGFEPDALAARVPSLPNVNRYLFWLYTVYSQE